MSAYLVHIKKNATGEVRQYTSVWPNAEERDVLYDWLENNHSCDCNRALCFKRAAGEDWENDETDCGEKLYSVLRIQRPDGSDLDLKAYWQ